MFEDIEDLAPAVGVDNVTIILEDFKDTEHDDVLRLLVTLDVDPRLKERLLPLLLAPFLLLLESHRRLQVRP